MFIINWIRRILLSWIDVAQDPQCIIDSLPIPVVNFHLVPASTGDWRAYEARFGKVPSKKETIFGYKLHLLVTMSGVILDFVLAPANETDLNAGLDMLFEHTIPGHMKGDTFGTLDLARLTGKTQARF